MRNYLTIMPLCLWASLVVATPVEAQPEAETVRQLQDIMFSAIDCRDERRSSRTFRPQFRIGSNSILFMTSTQQFAPAGGELQNTVRTRLALAWLGIGVARVSVVADPDLESNQDGRREAVELYFECRPDELQQDRYCMAYSEIHSPASGESPTRNGVQVRDASVRFCFPSDAEHAADELSSVLEHFFASHGNEIVIDRM